MKLGTKLLMAPLLTAAVALSVGELNAALMTRASGAQQEEAQAQTEHFKALSGVQAQLGQLHASVYRTVALMASLDDAKVKALRADLAQQLASVQKTLGSRFESSADAQLRAAGTEAGTQVAKYLKSADEAIDLASVDPNTGIAALQTADTAFQGLGKTVNGMAARVDTLTEESSAAARANSSRNHLLLALIGLAAAGAAVFLSWRMQRSLVSDLGHAAKMADTVASGDLSAQPDSTRADEVGELLRALARMATQLNESLRTVRDSSQSIQTASSEIASGNQDLSQRTEQTASRLQQAASAMTELTGTLRQSADATSTANQLATSAAQVAKRGGDVVAQVVTTMDEINASSKKISDIIGTIDGIAFQTNILALNAAVEAARAGEQGRGFAVVAGEVRSLAQRSAEAAKQIKILIGNSVDRVETGARLVQDAGSTMNEIVASVGRVSDIIGEIRASTVEQSEGIGKVSTSVGELDQMTQQNAALVEESAAAAESLREQAGKLSGLVSNFHLQGDTKGTASAPAPAPRPAIKPMQHSMQKPAAKPAPRPTTKTATRAPQAKPTPLKSAVSTPAAPATASEGDWQSF